MNAKYSDEIINAYIDGELDGVEEAARHCPRRDRHRDRQEDDGGESEDQRGGRPGHGGSQRPTSAPPEGGRVDRSGLWRGAR